MADKYHGAVKAGSLDIEIVVELRNAADSLEKTLVVASGVTAFYRRQGGSPTSVAVSDLTALTDAHTDGGWKEYSSTNMKGLYRFDLPDAAIAIGADFVAVSLTVTGAFVFNRFYALESENAASLNTDVDAIKLKTDNLPSAVKKNTAFTAFPFFLVQNSDHVSPATGKTPSGFVSKDGGAFVALTNSPAEIGNGWYKVTLTAAELNADVVILRFTATGADDRSIPILTKP